MNLLPRTPRDQVGLLSEAEEFWRDRYDWLKASGYQLRPRYHPQWVPSWKGTKKPFVGCEEYLDADYGLNFAAVYLTVFAHLISRTYVSLRGVDTIWSSIVRKINPGLGRDAEVTGIAACLEPSTLRQPCIDSLGSRVASSSPLMNSIPPDPGWLSHKYNSDKLPWGLLAGEYEWVKMQPWLAQQGYMLRPRYHPDWIPSWLGTGKDEHEFEDAALAPSILVMDAVRVSDDSIVAIKLVSKSWHPFEAEIGRFLSSEPLASDPSNHCVPIYDVLQSPIEEDEILLVMPWLVSPRVARFATIGEVIGMFAQLFEGLQFMHSQHVAHRDIGTLNVMMDPTIYSDLPHPEEMRRNRDFSRRIRRYTRTECPPKYYLIDFGLSRRYSPEDKCPMAVPIMGGDKTVPEFQEDSDDPQNPFWTDIYYLGNYIREDFVQKCHGLDFLEPLIDGMVQSDPSKRPTIEEARALFEEIRGSLSWWTLRSRIVHRKDWLIPGIYRSCRHVVRTARYILSRKPAIPSPP